ncbi:MAG: hypothetical protein QNJ32_14815 [Xenococcaceae cyanobacterium MO_167.B27]|nr:hypothetical protein [Xenococcaceae cyanobacterium MO_167.B27]
MNIQFLAPKVNSTQKFLERNYSNNLKSDYTEIIQEIHRDFDYTRNSQHYWSEPELSLLYGTPLYEKCSQSQKIALNHLYWYASYKVVADSETEATRYNLITAGSFLYKSSDYQSLADMLEHETDQENVHIRTFYKIGYQVYKNLIEQDRSHNPVQTPSHNPHPDQSESLKVLNHLLSQLNENKSEKSELRKAYENNIYVKKFNADKRAISPLSQGFSHGFSHGNFSNSIRQLFSSNWGSSPFLGSTFYMNRYMANLLLKNFEYKIHKYYVKLEKENEFIPQPTSISHYHFLDEAFHTTTSLKLSRDIHKELPKPSEYEKFFTNVLFYTIQSLNLGGLSAIIPNRFISDTHNIPFLYNLLRSPLFGMSIEETLYWMEKCLCYEHDGFYTNKKYHSHLLTDLCRLTDNFDYLWPINRTMQLVDFGGSIAEAVRNNVENFKQFTNSVKAA